MHFTDEEKEIIKKIALKERYTLNDFFRDNYEKRPKENLHRDWRAQNGWNNFAKLNGIILYDAYEFHADYQIELEKFISIWIILEKINLVSDKIINSKKIKINIENFGIKESSGYFINEELCKDYEDFLLKELIIFRERIQEFINDNFKTKDELNIEEEKKARNEALKDAKKSFWVSVFLALLSVVVSVIPLFKDDKVIVKNQINTQQLESQLKQTNQELKDIKNKFEELQKQSQISTKK